MLTEREYLDLRFSCSSQAMLANLGRLKGGAKGKEIVSSVPRFIQSEYPKYAEALDTANVDTRSVATLFIPTEAWLDTWKKERHAVDTDKAGWDVEYLRLASEIKVLSLKDVAVDPAYKGGVARTKIRTEVRISEVKNGKFEVYSGADGKTVAKCTLTGVVGAPNHRGNEIEQRKLSVAKIDSGKIDPVTLSASAAKMTGGFELEVIDADNNRIKTAIHNDSLMNSVSTNMDYYAPTVAGMLRYVELHMSEHAEDAKVIGMFGTSVPMATFYALVQPHSSRRQLVSHELIKAWRGAPYYPASGCAEYINGFISQHRRGDPSMQKKASEEFSSGGIALPEKSMLNKIKTVYSEYAMKAFDLTEGQIATKLWCDSLAFAIYATLMEEDSGRFNRAATQAENSDGNTYDDGVSVLQSEKWSEWAGGESQAASVFIANGFLLHSAATIEKLPTEPKMNTYLRNFVKMNSSN